MQDQSKTSGQIVSQSKGQSQRGPTPAKRNKSGEYRSNPAGTPQNNYSNVQGPYGGKSKGYQGPPSHSHSVTKKSTGLSNNPKIQITASAAQYPLPSDPNRTPHTYTSHPNSHPKPHNFPPPPGFAPYSFVSYPPLPSLPPPFNPKPLPPAPNPYPERDPPPRPPPGPTLTPQKVQEPPVRRSPSPPKKQLSLPNIHYLMATCTHVSRPLK